MVIRKKIDMKVPVLKSEMQEYRQTVMQLIQFRQESRNPKFSN